MIIYVGHIALTGWLTKLLVWCWMYNYVLVKNIAAAILQIKMRQIKRKFQQNSQCNKCQNKSLKWSANCFVYSRSPLSCLFGHVIAFDFNFLGLSLDRWSIPRKTCCTIYVSEIFGWHVKHSSQGTLLFAKPTKWFLLMR